MASGDERTYLLGTVDEARSLSGTENIAFSPGGYSMSRSYGSAMRVGAHRPRRALRTGRGSGRRIHSNSRSDNNDPLHGVRKPMPYETLVKQLEENPDAEIRRVSSAGSSMSEHQRLRVKYYNSCRNFARLREREADQRLRDELESQGAFEATVVEDAHHEFHDDGFLVYPDHMLAPEFFVLQVPLGKAPNRGDKQSSVITILSIWNTMMGTSLLSVPWALSQSGIVMGIIIACGMSIVSAYTALLVLRTHKKESLHGFIPEFAQMCGRLMGSFWEYLGSFFSLIAITGAAVVYWVLMSNFLYNTVTFIYDSITGSSHVPGNDSHSGVYCPSNPDSRESFNLNVTDVIPSQFDFFWNQQTVPCFLLVLLPLISLRSISFFTKFNSLGTGTVLFLIGVVSYYAYTWGLNVNISDENSPEYVPLFKNTFFSLSGMLALGLFIHNAIITIVSNNKHPENNQRDTVIAFVLVISTYMFIGIVFYVSFPLPKSCIEDNFLNNFHLDDTLTVICRTLILFQLTTVFPLIMYILRKQAFLLIIGREHEKLHHITAVNAIVLTICILVACFYPSIGTIIRFSGAFCGFVIVFLLPCLVHLKSLKNDEKLTKLSILGHSAIILFGAANAVAQFSFF